MVLPAVVLEKVPAAVLTAGPIGSEEAAIATEESIASMAAMCIRSVAISSVSGSNTSEAGSTASVPVASSLMEVAAPSAGFAACRFAFRLAAFWRFFAVFFALFSGLLRRRARWYVSRTRLEAASVMGNFNSHSSNSHCASVPSSAAGRRWARP